MKKSLLFVFTLLLFLVSSPTKLQAQLGSSPWKFSNPKPFGFVSYQLSYADNNNALVVGEAGGIAKTTDGGGTWSYFAFHTNNAAGDESAPTFNDVQFVNSTLAYAVGNDGIMVKSIDGGINWSLLNTPFYAGQMEINTVHFTDANTGYIGGDGDATTRKATIYKTINGGASWEVFYEFPAPAIEWINGTILKARFTASGVGYVGGSGGMVFKFDGTNWQDYSITDATIFPNINAIDTVLYDNYNGGFDTVATTYADNTFGLNQQNYRAIAILNDTAVVVGTQNNGGLVRINTGTVSGEYLLLNNGSASATRYSPLNSPQIYNLASKDGITIAGATSNAKLLLSKDKGFTWTEQAIYAPTSSEGEISFYGVDISAAGRFGLCGQAGIVADSATQWRKPFKYTKKSLGFSGYGLVSISFADGNHGIAAGSGGTILRTSDAGANWEDVSNPSFNPWDYYTSIYNPTPNTLLAAASNGMFYKSFDRASNFDLLFTEPNGGNLTALHFINEDTGWMVANVRYPDNVNYVDTLHQIIYHTYDGGSTWDTSTTVFPYETDYFLNNYLYDIKFLDRKIGYAAGANGTVYKSTDGGFTWFKQTNVPAFATDKSIKSIDIVDENTAFASGDQALVMKTVDGGATWTMANNSLPTLYANYPKILMYNASQGLVFGRGAVHGTMDGGASWTPYYVPMSDMLGTAAFAPIAGCTTGVCKKVFAGGFFRGNILKLDLGLEGGPLPVKFSNLTGSGSSEGNQLFWTAFEQASVNYFEVERSANGTSFSKIGDKFYPGTYNSQSYQWLDVTGAGRNFYRIKAVEKTGAVYYTNIIVISSKKVAKWNYLVSSGSLILNNVKALQGNVTATLINTAGQIVAAKSWSQQGGAFNQSMLLPPGAKGVHVLKINNGASNSNFTFFIQ